MQSYVVHHIYAWYILGTSYLAVLCYESTNNIYSLRHKQIFNNIKEHKIDLIAVMTHLKILHINKKLGTRELKGRNLWLNR